MFKLNETESKDLLAQPETGMGYQIVEATLRDNTKQRGTAYNAELLFLRNEGQIELRKNSYRDVLKSAPSSGNEIRALRVLPREAVSLSSRVRDTSSVFKKATPAKDAPIEKTKTDEVFRRFTAFEDDKRRRPDGSWRDGTYATTEEDAKNVKTGTDAVARYALPNILPASNVFTGRPQIDTEIQKGIVAAEFGQPGSGIEVFFRKGTQPSTVTGPTKIPDK
jgi:hypothetical protein